MFLNFWTDRSAQTEEESDQGLHCLSFLVGLPCSNFRLISGVRIFRNVTVHRSYENEEHFVFWKEIETSAELDCMQ